MKIEQVKKLSAIDRLLYFINERNQVRLKKRLGKKRPWTDDAILQSVYFCNVRREDDKVTMWVEENILNPLKGDPAVVFAVIAFRWFNYIPTGNLLRGLLVHWDLPSVISQLKSVPGQVFTGAFNISNSGSTKPKINRVCEDYIQPVWMDRDNLVRKLSECVTLSTAHKILSGYPGLGGSGFMAAQIICDLAYTHVLERAADWWTWSSPGPGSKRGLNRLLGRPVDNPVPKDWEGQMNKLRQIIFSKLKIRLHARDAQNCLCEYDKYVRVLTGEGQSKRKYNGR